MTELIAIKDDTGEVVIEERKTQPCFSYTSGCDLMIMDFADGGVKIELFYANEDLLGIILPVKKAEQLMHWLSCTLGQPVQKLPTQLRNILKRAIANKEWKYGDKRKLKEAIKVLGQYGYA